ncbi:acyl-CoA synthetase [Novosphingobium sp. SG720]|uniref:acyl-CoA synthetase n=1 Tax=Novosphingobium sp. SG720 TaxID=2586998 RepID=UPI0014470288|nr:acyl-CoA synthetase [Novosphingobium sp. SG720]NKJ42320.1 long-chain acyl-CoA synthetase [Novosphingobium sp. SG720]
MHPADHAARNPHKAALVLAETGETICFGTLEALSNQSAWQLRALGLRRGDVVATLFANAPEVFVFGWAAQRSGLYQTAISNKLSPRDIAYILRDCGAKLLVVSAEHAELAQAALADLPNLSAYRWTGADDRLGDWQAAAARLPETRIADESAGTDLLYSSGTTGRPKGVMPALPDGPIGAETPLMRMGATLYGMDQHTVYLSTSPLYHAAPLRWAMAVQQLGGTVVVMERFDAQTTLRLIERHRITHATFVPTHFVRMLKLPDAVRAAHDLSSLRAVVHAAAPCPVLVKRAMIDWFGPIVHEYYSGTECCGITALSCEEWLQKPGSVGRAVLGQLHVLDEAGQELPPGAIGSVYFSDGPTFEYLNDPEKTAEAHDARGWATLGDIGHVDRDGFLFLSDRKSFMIISGGVNIYPQEIENLLVTHPAVADVAVIGVPCEEMGELVLAVVQPAPSISADAALAEELRAFARRELGSVKTPRRIDFTDALPREPTGKLFKRLLRERYAPPTG